MKIEHKVELIIGLAFLRYGCYLHLISQKG